jgi:hypothetical protein
MKNLYNEMQSYKNITVDMIGHLENDDIEGFEDLLGKRQEIIGIIDKLDYTEDEFTSIYNELEIQRLQKRCDDMMKRKLKEAKGEFVKTSDSLNINRRYYNNSSVDSIFVNKKI